MKLLLIITICLIISSSASYRVDLDDITSYTPVLEGKRPVLLAYLGKIKAYLQNHEIAFIYMSFLAQYPPSLFLSTHGSMAQFTLFTSQYLDIPYEDLVLGFIIYEFGCLSAIVRDDEGQIYLARNLDYGFKDELKQLFVNIDFYKGNNLIYSGIQQIGVGNLLNVIKIGQFSISLNKRYGTSTTEIAENYRKGALSASFVLGLLAEKSRTFDEVLFLADELFLSSRIYFAIAGTKTGCILEREPKGLNRKLWLTGKFVVVAK